MGLIKTVQVDANHRISINCVKETLKIKPQDFVEVHVVDGRVEIRKKETK